MKGLVRKYKLSLIDTSLKLTEDEINIINEHLVVFDNLKVEKVHHDSDIHINFRYEDTFVVLLINKTLNIKWDYTDKTRLSKSPFILKSIVLDLFGYYYPQLEIDRVYLQGYGVVN